MYTPPALINLLISPFDLPTISANNALNLISSSGEGLFLLNKIPDLLKFLSIYQHLHCH